MSYQFIPDIYAEKVRAMLESQIYGRSWIDPLTPEERAAAEARREARKAYEQELQDQLFAPAPIYANGIAIRKIVDLHSPSGSTYPYCQGCDFSGYEAEEPSWPCRTIRLLGEILGIKDPDAVV